MKLRFLITYLVLLSSSLSALTYYSEREEGFSTFIFHGYIDEKDEHEVKSLEEKFMEYASSRWHYKNELENLGVKVEKIERGHHGSRGKPPFDIDYPHPPEAFGY